MKRKLVQILNLTIMIFCVCPNLVLEIFLISQNRFIVWFWTLRTYSYLIPILPTFFSDLPWYVCMILTVWNSKIANYKHTLVPCIYVPKFLTRYFFLRPWTLIIAFQKCLTQSKLRNFYLTTKQGSKVDY